MKKIFLNIFILSIATFAQSENIYQITDNIYDDEYPKVSGNVIVWQGIIDNVSNNAEIFLYNNGLINQLTNNIYTDCDAKISGNNVTWQGMSPWEVFSYNGSLVRQLTDTPFHAHNSNISGMNIVWEAQTGFSLNSSEIFLFDGLNIIQITDNSYMDSHAQIWGNKITWWRHDGNDREIFYYNGSNITQITNNSFEDFAPQISDNNGNVAWHGDDEIFLFDGNNVTQITNNSYDDESPDISGNNVVWRGYDGNDYEIFLYNGSFISQITENNFDDAYPQVLNEYVVWHGYDGNDYEIYISNGFVNIQLTENNYDDLYPKISNNCATWQGWDGQDFEIFYSTIPIFNQNPIANAGDDQTAHPGNIVTLDGSGSSDPDEQYPLIFHWEIVSKPEESMAQFSNPNIINPSFTPDHMGDYYVELVVTDSEGLESLPDTVKISTSNTAPVAYAGLDQSIIEIGTIVQMDGSQSYDEDGDDIEYSWAFSEIPQGSSAEFSDLSSPTTTFEADVHGEYIIELVVIDIFGAISQADEITVSFENIRPVADAGDNQAVMIGENVSLNGDGSFDANHDILAYSWNFVALPPESNAELISPISQQTEFLADLVGTYIVSLIVNDGIVDSDADNVTITVTSSTEQAIQCLMDLIDVINELEPEVFKNKKMRKALTNKVNAIIEKIEQGLIQDAIDKLEHDILKKTNGCFDIGNPDKNDWILACEAQRQLMELLNCAINSLEL